MLIRSQDKKKITNDLCLEIVENEYTHAFEIFNNSVGVIGEYSTEEKAIKSLDLVCFYYKEDAVYYMPKDNDLN